MAHLLDYLIDIVKNSWVEKGGATVGLLTVTRAAAVGRHHIICKVDASYASSTASHELRVYFNTGGSRVIVGRKHIHGAGALDFGELGLQNPTINQAVEAELDADASAGDITFTGYSTGPDA
jgi:hypothetical protein